MLRLPFVQAIAHIVNGCPFLLEPTQAVFRMSRYENSAGQTSIQSMHADPGMGGVCYSEALDFVA